MRRRRLLTGLATLGMVAAIASPSLVARAVSAQATGRPILILISIDGFRWDYAALHPEAAPRLRELAHAGATAKSLVPVFPSNTFTNHYTIVTGLYPAHHGILNNRFFDPALGRPFVYNVPQVARQSEWWQGEPIWNTAFRKAAAMNSMAAQCTTPRPGRTIISAPMQPTTTALQRRIPTFSPRSGTDSAVSISGPAMEMAMASANGTKASEKTNMKVETMLHAARPS